MLKNRDYTLMIDQSASMAIADQPGGKTRWEAMQESTLALVNKCQAFDPDGITVYVFSNRFKRYENVTSSQVKQIFQENQPQGGTNLTGVLQDATNNYFKRKGASQTKPEGETIVVVTDGEPDDRIGVAEAIVNASHRMKRDEELAILFVQVGFDPKVTRSLKAFDDQLRGIGAKFDIVDTISLDDMETMTLTDVLLNAIAD